MIELSRFQQLRPLQTTSDEETRHLGLPLYPDDTLSDFANILRNAKTKAEFSEAIARYAHSRQILVNEKDLNPLIKSLYDWFSYKARPISLKDFTTFSKSLRIEPGLKLEDEWRAYADNLIAAIQRGVLHLNYCI